MQEPPPPPPGIDSDVGNTLTSHQGPVGNTPSIAEVKKNLFSDMPLKETLSTADLEARLRVIHGKTPKAGQLLAIETLFNEEKDVILIAKTGYGKSMVFHSVSALEEDTMTLMIMPLLALEEGQKQAIKKMQANSNPCILNGETMTKTLLNEIQSGIYTHVLTSPEIAISNKEFRQVLQHSNVQQRLVLVAIDEVHLVEDWGSWGKDYYKLGELRSVVPRRVPFFATSATLDNVLLKKVTASLRFAEDVRVIRESIDREDIFYHIRSIHESATATIEDLRFLVNDSVKPVPKTIIYGDSITRLVQMKEILKRFYMEVGASSPTASEAIRSFNGLMSTREKTRICEEFRKRDSNIRILCCDGATNAMGFGMDIPDVEIVVQWKAPPSLRALVERAGRAARAPDRMGEFIWLHPVWCKGERTSAPANEPGPSQLRQVMSINDDVDSESEVDEEKRKEQVMKRQENQKTLKDSRAALEDSLYRMINEPGCARKIILSAFDEPDLQDFDKRRYETGCCSKCTPEGGHAADVDAARKVKATAPRPKAKKFERLAIIEDLEIWRDRVGLLEFQGSRLTQGGQCKFFMSEAIMKSISRDATAFADVNDLRQAAANWPTRWLNKYADEVFEVVKHAILRADPKVTETAKNQSKASKEPLTVATDLEGERDRGEKKGTEGRPE